MASSDTQDSRVNLAALKRVDPYAVEILETGTQVAIYKFSNQTNEWDKTDVEGTFFLYARSGDPRHGFVVMNRLSTENLVEPITKDLEIENKAPFVLYKNAKNEITGAWFYEESECSRISQMLIALVKEESQRRRPSAAQQEKPATGVDILSLLTKAHGEYEQKGKPAVPTTSASTTDVVRPTALRPPTNGASPHSTALSVADLFATTEPVTPMPLGHRHDGSLFERLLSVGTPTGMPSPNLPTAELHSAQNLERELRGKDKQKVTNGTVEHQGPARTSARANGDPRSNIPGMVANSIPLARPQVAEVMQHGASATPPRHAGLQSVALMSPMMFASAGAPTGSNEQPVEAARVLTPVHRLPYQAPMKDDPPPPYYQTQKEEQHLAYQSESEVTPLTKAQLMQAFNYLLKNDPNFITQLHDAYVQSLKLSLKTGGHN